MQIDVDLVESDHVRVRAVEEDELWLEDAVGEDPEMDVSSIIHVLRGVKVIPLSPAAMNHLIYALR